jgi:cell wall-associated NlpC family hydrolase
MKKICRISLFLLAAGFVISCGTTQRSMQPVAHGSDTSDKTERNLPTAVSISSYSTVKSSLHRAHSNWKGTPYRWGGSSRNGIDCSAFMQVLFDQYFNIDLPRNTKRQLYAGSSVRRNALNTGDLVFFKTGRQTLHVGVLIEDNEFLHASTSEGVTISNMDDYYWKSRYLAGRRVVHLQ